MSRKIIGVTVGTTLPKPNFKQTDPTKGDYIKNKPDFDGLKDRVDTVSKLVGDTAVSEQIAKAIGEINYPVDSVNGQTGDVQLTASDVGALPDTTEIPSIEGLATEKYVDDKVAAIVDSAPETLDTLNELAAALGNDKNFATTVATQIGQKVDKVEGKGLSTNDYTNEEKAKLSKIEDGATKVIVDEELSDSSTNPVQNKVINAAISSINIKVGDKSVSEQISDAIAEVDDMELITIDDIDAICDQTIGVVNPTSLILNSITNGSDKQFVITIDDTGTITIAEIVTEEVE